MNLRSFIYEPSQKARWHGEFAVLVNGQPVDQLTVTVDQSAQTVALDTAKVVTPEPVVVPQTPKKKIGRKKPVEEGADLEGGAA